MNPGCFPHAVSGGRALGLACVSLLLSVAADGGQQPAPARFPSGVERVVVDAIVVDREGRSVAGLSRGDFVLTEDGMTQAITSLERFEVGTAPPPGAPAVPGAPAAAPAAPAGSGGPARVFALVFDDLGLTRAQGERARSPLRDLVGRATDRDLVLLAVTSGEGGWSARTATEREDLLAAIEGLQGRFVPDLSAERITDAEAYQIHVEEDPLKIKRVGERYLMAGVFGDVVKADAALVYQRAARRTERALDVLERLAGTLSGAHRPKSIVFVSPGFFYEPRSPQYRRVLDACRRANAAIHFLNVAGIEAMPAPLTAQFAQPVAIPGAKMELSESQADQAGTMSSYYAMARDADAGAVLLANDSGGLVATDLARGVERIDRESRASYLLGYVPASAPGDGRYRRIRVGLAPGARPDERKGWHVRARSGYYPDPVSAAAPAKADPAAELARALDSPFERSELPVRLSAYAFEDSEKTPGSVRCRLVAEAEGAAIAFRELKDRAAARLDAVFETLARDGGERQRTRQQADLKLGAATRDRVRRDAARLVLDVELPPGVHETKVAVRDAATGKTGSATARLDVPAPRSFRRSTAVLSDAFENDEQGWPQPVPTARREFQATGSVYVSFDVYGAALDPRSHQSDVTMGYEVVAPDGTTVLQTTPVRIDPNPRGALHRFLGFELEGGVPGEYRLVSRLFDQAAGRGMTLVDAFSVQPWADEPPPAPATADAALDALLARAGRYVTEYEHVFHDIVVEEEYRQRATGEAGFLGWRNTRAELVFTRLPGAIPWGSFRDVFELNGQPVRARDDWLERLFREDPAHAVDRASAILAESARYNIGPQRTVNLPTLALLFLHPQNQARFAFERRGGRPGEPMEVAFRETARPTIVRDERTDRRPARGRDLPAEGRFWIDPAAGTVTRSEVVFRFRPFEDKATITTTYRLEPRLSVWVPAEMREQYEGHGGNLSNAEAVARYSKLRQFTVQLQQGEARTPRP